MRSELASCVLWKGNLYGFDAKRLTCLDWRTGAVKWAGRAPVQGSLILADGKLIALQENGMLLIAEATDQAYRWWPGPKLCRDAVGPCRYWPMAASSCATPKGPSRAWRLDLTKRIPIANERTPNEVTFPFRTRRKF